MGERVEATAQLVVGQLVDELRGFGAICLPLRRSTADRTGQGADSERRGDQRSVAQLRRRIDCASRPGAHRVVVPAVEAVAGKLDHELGPLRGVRIPELGEGGLEVGVRLLVTAEKVLDAGACGGEPDAQRLRFLGHDAHALE